MFKTVTSFVTIIALSAGLSTLIYVMRGDVSIAIALGATFLLGSLVGIVSGVWMLWEGAES